MVSFFFLSQELPYLAAWVICSILGNILSVSPAIMTMESLFFMSVEAAIEYSGRLSPVMCAYYS